MQYVKMIGIETEEFIIKLLRLVKMTLLMKRESNLQLVVAQAFILCVKCSCKASVKEIGASGSLSSSRINIPVSVVPGETFAVFPTST